MNEIKLRKIPLASLIEQLIELYNSGADFVDVVGMNGEEKDTIGIVVKNEYVTYNRHMEDVFQGRNLIEDDIEDKPLSDDDINQLLT